MPVLPMSVLVPILHLGMVEQVCDLRRHAQHLLQVVVVVGIKPWLPAQKPCFLTTTLPRLLMGIMIKWFPLIITASSPNIIE